MTRKFTANVVMRDPNYNLCTFNVGDIVPDWAGELGDHVWSNSAPSDTPVQTPAENVVNDDTSNDDDSEADAPAVPEDDADADDDVPPYSEWSKTDLKSEVAGRGLTGLSKATIEELVEALEADDLANG